MIKSNHPNPILPLIIREHVINYPTPMTINYFFGFGFIAGVFLAIQIFSGVFLAMFYIPGDAFKGIKKKASVEENSSTEEKPSVEEDSSVEEKPSVEEDSSVEEKPSVEEDSSVEEKPSVEEDSSVEEKPSVEEDSSAPSLKGSIYQGRSPDLLANFSNRQLKVFFLVIAVPTAVAHLVAYFLGF